jgi:parvulin-like peptidyl-prolyl isomerase/predicted small lipoprotein YifL
MAAAVLCAVLPLAACGDEGPLRSPAARVNGEAITDADVRANVPLFEFLSSVQQSSCGTTEEGEEAGDACSRFVLENLIQEELVRAYATEHDLLTVPDDEVQDAIGPLEQSLGGAQGLDDRLVEAGLSRRDLERLTARLLVFRNVRDDVTEAAVSVEELQGQYEERIVEFTVIHARHILVATEEEAAGLADRATPSNFEDLARRFSTDPGAAQNGGDLGTRPASEFVPEFAEAAVALEPGEISEPVESQFGWHVILLVEKEVRPIDDVRQQLLDEAASRAYQEWLEGTIADAEIDVNPRYGRFDPGTGRVLSIRSTVTTGAPEDTPEG